MMHYRGGEKEGLRLRKISGIRTDNPDVMIKVAKQHLDDTSWIWTIETDDPQELIELLELLERISNGRKK